MLTIHGVPISIHTRKVIITALEKNLEHRVELVFPFDPPAGWKERSPTGKIPTLTDEGFNLADSSVIVAYLEKKFPERPVYPRDMRAYAQALWFEEYVDGQIAPDVIGIFQQKVFGPMLHQRAPDQTVIDRLLQSALPPKFDYLENALHGDYLAGNEPSIADITIASNLLNFRYLGCTMDARRYPRLAAHFTRMLRRDSFRKALPAEQPFAEKMGLDHGFLRSIG
jgi:glutathione S-transferase